jgi:hypothetical protein
VQLELMLDAHTDNKQSMFPSMHRHCSLSQIIWTLESQSFHFIEFIKATTETITVDGQPRFSELNQLKWMLQIAINLEHHADCLIIWDMFSVDTSQTKDSSDLAEI